jgi:hypothetical protein
MTTACNRVPKKGQHAQTAFANASHSDRDEHAGRYAIPATPVIDTADLA